MGGKALTATPKTKKAAPKRPAPEKRASLAQTLQFSSTKDIRLNPVFRGSLSKWTWRFYTHRLTRAGRWFSGLTFTLAFLGLISLNTQGYIPFLYVSALWFVALVCAVFNRPRIEIKSWHASRIAQGETLPVEAEVTQGPRWGFDLNLLPARLPLEVDAAPPDGTPLGALAPRETRRVRVGLLCNKRGVYRLFGFRVESDFPFGLLNAYRVVKQESSIIVHPAFTPLLQMDLPTGERFHAGGVAVASHRGDSFEYLGNRDFREGDNLRDIDWRATARQASGMPVIREWREEFVLRVGIVLDTLVPPIPLVPRRGTALTGRSAETFEQAVSLCAAVGDYVARQDYLVDIFAAGPVVHQLVQGRGAAYSDQILDILAAVETTQSEPLTVIAPQVDDTLGQLTTVICVFLGWDDTRSDFVDNLRASGVGVKVVLIGDTTKTPAGRDIVVLSQEMLAGQIDVL